jgi:hypothetical protein
MNANDLLADDLPDGILVCLVPIRLGSRGNSVGTATGSIPDGEREILYSTGPKLVSRPSELTTCNGRYMSRDKADGA